MTEKRKRKGPGKGYHAKGKARKPHPKTGQKYEAAGTALSPWKGNGGPRPGAGRLPAARKIVPLIDRMKLAEMARSASPRMLAVLRRIAEGRYEGADVGHILRAIEIILERGFGRAPQGLPIPEQPSGIVGLVITQEMLSKLNEKQQESLERLLLALAGDHSVGAGSTDASQVGEERFASTVGYTKQ